MSSKKKNKKTAQKKVPVILSKVARPAKFGGLGRGLDALIGGASAKAATSSPVQPEPAAVPAAAPAADVSNNDSATTGRHVLSVAIGMVHPSPWQPRHVFNEELLEELAASIRTHGVIQPLVCRRIKADNYELIAGERRLRAATAAGLAEVPVVLLEAEDRDAAEMSLVENLQREDLNVIEEAEGYKALAESFGLTQQDIAERVGKARASIANSLRLLDLSDEIRELLTSGMIHTGHAKVLLGIGDADQRLALAKSAAGEGWTVRMLEQKIRKFSEPKKVRTVSPDIPADYLSTLLELLHEKFGTSVRLFPSATYANGKRAKGRIEVDFFDNDDLDRLLTVLGISVDEF